MKRIVSIALSTTLIAALAACGGGGGDQAAPAPAPAPAEQQQPAAGGGGTVDATAAEAKYNQGCAACHGADLSGGAGPALKQVGAKLSEEQILGIINNGQGGMPPKMLQGADAELVAAWLAEHK
ncbi:cytochrome c [Ammoniphilus sp. CFH 90114]|uniref:c-type cytochrome n=1 Tax=Ammoniphilus sp. CFH 90114 TaxID=2493665 RepID=UPI00100FB4F5|nr:cytochrome c [Ammoniphilus sp. CFH 90114]RXT13765.1 cytochrome c [Ammoniphilus sp. CFH 90114]